MGSVSVIKPLMSSFLKPTALYINLCNINNVFSLKKVSNSGSQTQGNGMMSPSVLTPLKWLFSWTSIQRRKSCFIPLTCLEMFDSKYSLQVQLSNTKNRFSNLEPEAVKQLSRLAVNGWVQNKPISWKKKKVLFPQIWAHFRGWLISIKRIKVLLWPGSIL